MDQKQRLTWNNILESGQSQILLAWHRFLWSKRSKPLLRGLMILTSIIGVTLFVWGMSEYRFTYNIAWLSLSMNSFLIFLGAMVIWWFLYIVVRFEERMRNRHIRERQNEEAISIDPES